MSEVLCSNISKLFGGFQALREVSLSLNKGQILSLVGPSGCGKTTLLRILSGLEQSDGGKVEIGGVDVTAAAPEERQLGMVFQSYALWPHMTVAEHISFALEARQGRHARAVKGRIDELAHLLHIDELLSRYPHQLSGGQQQRVSLARALAPSPRLLLLDEPFANLDTKLRSELRAELRRLQSTLQMTMIFVTHDQSEAMSLGDRIAVMQSGAIVQEGPSTEVYAVPRTAFVADFFCGANTFSVSRAEGGEWVASFGALALTPDTGTEIDRLVLAIAPERVRLMPAASSEANTFRAKVVNREFVAHAYRLEVELEGGQILRVLADRVQAAQAAITTAVGVHFPPDALLMVEDAT